MLHLDVPAGIPKLPVLGIEPQQILHGPRSASSSCPYARFDIDGTENIPEDGPAIIVGNHRSYFDPMAIGMTLAKRGRPVRFLGKKEVFDAPLVGPAAAGHGRHPRRPRHRLRRAAAGGGRRPRRRPARRPHARRARSPAVPAFFDPVLKGRWGAARLAAMTGAPVIPVGLWGTEKVWPRSSQAPNVLNVLDPPTIRIRVGDRSRASPAVPPTPTRSGS